MKILSRVLGALTLFAFPAIASAHAFGQQYTLPLPRSLYITGGSLALVASFAVLALYSTPQRPGPARVVRTFALKPWARKTLGALGIFALLLTVITGAFGNQLIYANPAPILFWIVLLLYATYANAIVGGLWDALNPFKHIAAWAFEGIEPLYAYPKRLGFLPALVFYYFLIWTELFSGAGGNALVLSIGLQVYFALMLLGCFLYGVEDWFTYGDFFTVFFRLVGRFAPFQLEGNKVETMQPGERLVSEEALRYSVLIFILFMLSSTAFDGLRDTSAWVNAILALPLSLSSYFAPLSQLALLLSPFIFFGLYFLAIWLMRVLTRDHRTARGLALRFAYSLLPIAIVYNFAHYFGLLFTDAQYLIPLASDPFGVGWNLFGTAHYSVNIGLIGAAQIWYIQFAAIVLGHIMAAYIAHRIALREFNSRRHVLVGQIPMMILMVFYTAFGLWILSAPYAVGAI